MTQEERAMKRASKAAEKLQKQLASLSLKVEKVADALVTIIDKASMSCDALQESLGAEPQERKKKKKKSKRRDEDDD